MSDGDVLDFALTSWRTPTSPVPYLSRSQRQRGANWTASRVRRVKNCGFVRV